MKLLSDHLAEVYLDYINNYLTVEVFAEHHDITTIQARHILSIGKAIHEDRVLIFKA